MSGAVFVAVFGFIYFAMLDTKVPELIFIAMALSFIPIMMMYAAEAALIAEAFTPRLRYSGASLGYQLASIIAGGPAPFIATWLFSTYHSSLPISLYICICAAISICSALLLPDRTNEDVAHEVELRRRVSGGSRAPGHVGRALAVAQISQPVPANAATR